MSTTYHQAAKSIVFALANPNPEIERAEALASCVEASELNASYIVRSVFHPDVATKVAAAVRLASGK
jgi:malate dehydrogenase (oxaloacetate-decarboxylating)